MKALQVGQVWGYSGPGTVSQDKVTAIGAEIHSIEVWRRDGQPLEVHRWPDVSSFLSLHDVLVSEPALATPAESPILAMVPAAARASVVRVDYLDETGSRIRVERTDPEAAPRTFPGGLTSDQVQEIVARARKTLSEHMPTGHPGNDWDAGWDSGIEKVLRLLSEAVGEDL